MPTTAFGRGKLLGRTLDYFTFYLSAGFRLALDAQPGDVVVVKTDPPMLSVVAGPIARLKGARYINWLQDLFPEIATALGIGGSKTQKWAVSLLRRLRDLTLQYAEANVVLGERMSCAAEETPCAPGADNDHRKLGGRQQNPPHRAQTQCSSQRVEP